VKIILIVEGATESALRQHLKSFLDRRAREAGKSPVRLETRGEMTLDRNKLRGRVRRELRAPDVVGVVGLIDVFPDFKNAADAKKFLRNAVGNEPRFHAHAAQFDVEAWLLPYWDDICRRVGVRQSPPGSNPETVDSLNPPAYRLKALYQRARPKPRKYVKTTEMYAILKGKDLTFSAARCPEFKAFLNTLLTLSDLEPLP
jgi:hypothetical protein